MIASIKRGLEAMADHGYLAKTRQNGEDVYWSGETIVAVSELLVPEAEHVIEEQCVWLLEEHIGDIEINHGFEGVEVIIEGADTDVYSVSFAKTKTRALLALIGKFFR